MANKKTMKRAAVAAVAGAADGSVSWWFRESTGQWVFELSLSIAGSFSGVFRYPAKTQIGVLRVAKRYGGHVVWEIAKATKPNAPHQATASE